MVPIYEEMKERAKVEEEEEEEEEEGGGLPLSLIELGNQSPIHLDVVDTISFSPLTNPSTGSGSRVPPQPEDLMDVKGQTCYCSSPRDPGNKENHHTKSGNNLDMPVVAEEPLQTRKRKKGRGCNLRKSLAWNKAFFTEEGVLDPVELSTLSGSVSESTKSFLSRVNEGEPSPSPGSCGRGDTFSKSESSPQGNPPLPMISQSSRKALLTKGTSRSVPQGGGCPRPTTSHSQKKIINTSTANGISKIPKPLATKADSSRLSVAPKCVVQPAKRPKCNQNAPPVISVKNNSSKSPSSCTAKGLSYTVPAKTYVPRPGNHKANLPSETHLSVNLQTPQVGTAIETAKLRVIPEQALQVDMHASTCHANSDKDIVRLPHVQVINEDVPSAQYHTKPSGLRMPSPSLGYFCQGKLSASRNFLSDKSKPCNLPEAKNPTGRKPCDFKHIGELKPLSIPYGKPPKLCIDAPTIEVTRGVTVGSQVSSALMCPVSSIVTAKSNLDLKTLRKDGLEDSSDSWSQKSHSNHFVYGDGVSEQIGKQASIMANPNEIKQVSYKENHKLLIKGDSSQAEIASFDQPRKDDGSELASDDSNASGDTSGIELVNPDSLSRVSCGKQVTRCVSQLNKKVEHPPVEVAAFKEPPVVNEYQRPSNGHCPVDISDFVPDTQSVETKNNFDRGFCEEIESSLGLREDVGTAKSLKSICSSMENMASSHQVASQSYGSNNLDRDNGVESRLLSEETVTTLSGTGKQPDTGLQSQLKKDALSAKDETASIANKKKNADDDSRQDHISIDYRVNAVPFSDEWVAALEAVGEDILTMKTGAVQNSPPDKTIPEPGPYSPVKRTTQDIGPFDCTKYTSLATSDIQ